MQFQIIQLNEVNGNMSPEEQVIFGSDPYPFHVLDQWPVCQLTKILNSSEVLSSQETAPMLRISLEG